MERSERFLWGLRQTTQELVIGNHVGRIRDYAHRQGLKFSGEPYNMNRRADLELGALADVPMCEFESLGGGFKTEYIRLEAASTAQTMGKRIVAAQAFTVANLWINLLAGEVGLPEEQRLARTTRNPYTAGSPLQPSGLLGPVTVVARTPQ